MSDYPAVFYVEDDKKSRMVMDMLLKEHLNLTKTKILPDSHHFEANINTLPFQPDIIFLDIHMEPLNGFEMLNILRQHETLKAKPIVALTASVMNEEVQQLRDAGFNGVIPKPIDIRTFPNTLNRLLDGEQVWGIINK